MSLAGMQQREQFKRHVRTIGEMKAYNKGLYYIIYTITEAIEGFGKLLRDQKNKKGV